MDAGNNNMLLCLERPPSLIASSFDDVSDLGTAIDDDDDEESVFQAPSREELSRELCRLTDPRSSRRDTLSSLRQLHAWVLVAKTTNPEFARNLVEENVVPTLLYLVKNTPRNNHDPRDARGCCDDDRFLLDKAIQILNHCTYSSAGLRAFQRQMGRTDRSASSTDLMDRLTADMAVRFVQYKGVDILVTKLEEYRDECHADGRPCLFKTIWNTLLNIAACGLAVSLPEYDKSRQKERMMEAVELCLGKMGRTLPASWVDERLFLALHNLLRTNRRRSCVDSISSSSVDDEGSCYSRSTRPDDSVRMVLAGNGVVTQCLRILKRNRRAVFQDRTVTALAVTFLYECLRREGSSGADDDDDDTDTIAIATDEHHNDVLSRSLMNFQHLSLLVPFVVRAMKAYPKCNVIQGTGCLVLMETPKYLSKISLDIDDDSINDLRSLSSDDVAARTRNKETLRSVVLTFFGPCWYGTSN